MNRINRLLRYLSVWLRPPKVARVHVQELNGEAVDFVEPVFVLSTGRCGTAWLTELLRKDPKMRVNHNDYPELVRHSRLAYEQYEKCPRLFQEIVRATRDGYILDAYKRGRTYVETNNRIAFFAYALKTVYPQARFVHIVRHPGDFVRSGLRRGWYRGASHDVGRIRDHEHPEKWRRMTDVEKIAWLWNETNHFIERFLEPLDTDCYLQLRAEDMFSREATIREILRYIGADINTGTIRNAIARPVNKQRLGNVPVYSEWDAPMKRQLRQETTLVATYGYDL